MQTLPLNDKFYHFQNLCERKNGIDDAYHEHHHHAHDEYDGHDDVSAHDVVDDHHDHDVSR